MGRPKKTDAPPPLADELDDETGAEATIDLASETLTGDIRDFGGRSAFWFREDNVLGTSGLRPTSATPYTASSPRCMTSCAGPSR